MAKKINPPASEFRCKLILVKPHTSKDAGAGMAAVLRDIADRLETQYDRGEAFVKEQLSEDGILLGEYSFQIGIRRVEREELEPAVREKLPLHKKVFLEYCYETSAWHIRCAVCARVFVVHVDLQGNIEFHHIGREDVPVSEIPCGSFKPCPSP